ncbi:MAG: L-threonylcarbamoyladenylate synthase [Anaerolineales bacterium]|nr:L-threonylcarbamoyladenylate synthase [Anaerolineales bacterium]
MACLMITRLLCVHPQFPEAEIIAQAAAEIQRGGLVAFPTETVYGLGANALDAAAVARIFEAKGRPAEDPLIIHLAAADDLPRVVRAAPPIAHELARAFWPGALTLIMPRGAAVPLSVTAGLETAAVRVPAHPVALALLQAAGTPIAAPSANRFGRASPTAAQHVLHDLDGRIDLILDGGPTTIGIESTVLDVTRTPPLILRPGGVSREALEALIGAVELRGEAGLSPVSGRGPAGKTPQISPGLLDKHYAPRAELILCASPTPARRLEQMGQLAQKFLDEGKKVGLLIADQDRLFFAELPALIFLLGAADDLAQVARNLFAGMRRLDEQGAEVILARGFGRQGLGLAIDDRLRRAASRVVE